MTTETIITTENKTETVQQETQTEQKNSESTVVTNHQQAASSNSVTRSSENSSSQGNNQPQAEVRTQTAQATNSTPTPAPPQTQAPKKAPVRLTALGNTGLEFATLKEAGAWLQQKMDEAGDAFEAGKQNWVYTGNYFEIPWSDGHTTASVNLRKQ